MNCPLTAGVDLAAEPSGTAVAVLRWGPSRAELVHLALAADNDLVVEVALEADKVGIDCPFGWPDAWLAFLRAQVDVGGNLPLADTATTAARSSLGYRLTDQVVRKRTGKVPLMVAADRIGLVAMRCASLLRSLADAGLTVDKIGHGKVAEVYPAASLQQWGLTSKGYKGVKPEQRECRAALVGQLRRAAPWLDLGAHGDSVAASDHALDAVVAALTARAVVRGATRLPEPDQVAQVAREGWIHVPLAPLADVAS